MWTMHRTTLTPGRILHHRLERDGEPVPYGHVIDLWVDSPAFRSFFIECLAEAPFSALRWETPPVTAGTLDRPFEHVLVDSPWLDVPPDRSPFEEHFSASALAVAFVNLGRDAVLVAPCPPGRPADYAHLGAFLRNAPEVQQHALWQKVGRTMRTQVAAAPVWLSTAGGGVDWLHVRLDDRPKYYAHAPYRRPPAG